MRITRLLLLLALLLPFAAPTPPPAVTAAGSFVEAFDEDPATPTRFASPHWSIMRHKRNENPSPTGPAGAMDPMDAHHGTDCSPQPATHRISLLADAVFLCRDHMMTAINGGDYAAVVLTPDHMMDFSAGESVLRFDVSTFRDSDRDWWDVNISPWGNVVPMPLANFLPDGYGRSPKGLTVELSANNSLTTFVNDTGQELGSGRSMMEFLSASATRRDTIEIRLSKARVKVWMPAYGVVYADAAFSQPLTWDKGVVQIGHHSYTPDKGTGGANTWHWDNVSINPATSFGMVGTNEPADRTIRAENPNIAFARPVPAGGQLTMNFWGSTADASFNGGATWIKMTPRPTDKSLDVYWPMAVSVPAGATGVRFRGTAPSWSQGWEARNVQVWALDGALPDPTPPPPTAVPTVTPPPTATATATATQPPATATSPPATATTAPATPTVAPTAPPTAEPTATPEPSATPPAAFCEVLTRDPAGVQRWKRIDSDPLYTWLCLP